MKKVIDLFIRIVLLILIWLIWIWVLGLHLSNRVNLAIIFGGILLVFPLVLLGRRILDKKPTLNRAAWVTTFVHYSLGILIGIPICRALSTHRDWSVWTIPIPADIGLVLVIITCAATFLTVINLALKGLGAPFAIALSRKLAVDWMYSRTRNPMVLACLALLLSLGIWFQSVMFILWALFLFSPALLFFVKVYEERELEIRFGESYLDYKSKTPMLFPVKRRG